MFTLIITGCGGSVDKDREINVVFRFDDPHARSLLELELKIIDAFRAHNASVTFGVIPFICNDDCHDTSPQGVTPLGSKKGKLLGKAVKDGVLDIALHGYSHQTRVLDPEHRTEFLGLDYDSQLEKLSMGKNLLEELIEVPVTAFIPPWNKYDHNTLKALEKLGFSSLSADFHGEAPDSSNLNFIPFTCRLPQLREAVKQARISSDEHPLIVVMFHNYDFKEFSEKGKFSYEAFYDLLSWTKSQKDIQVLSISQATETIKDLSAKRLRLSILYKSIESIVPKFLKVSTRTYMESSSVLSALTMTILLYLLIIVLGILFFYIIVCFVTLKSVKIMKFGTFGTTLFTVAVIIYSVRDLSVGFYGMVVIAILTGFSIGSWICYGKERKKIGK